MEWVECDNKIVVGVLVDCGCGCVMHLGFDGLIVMTNRDY